MTEHKPPRVSVESWVDRQIREAAERGEFDDLPGAGQPLPGHGGSDDEMWWVKGYLRSAGAPRPARPGPGRPNRRYDVHTVTSNKTGKTTTK